MIDKVIVPHVEKMRQQLGLLDQKALLIWDAFTGQNTPAVLEKLDELNILTALVPKNLTHLLQPLDITTNGVFKKMEKKAFSEYLTKVIMDHLLENPDDDVATIDVDLRLSILKPRHLITLTNIFKFFGTEHGKRIILSAFRFTGITDAEMVLLLWCS